MISTYLVDPSFGEASLKCNGNAAFSFKKTQNKKASPFCLKSGLFCYADGCPYFLNMVLNKVCSE